MKVILKSEGREHELASVEKIICISKNLTLVEELQDTILIIHSVNHCEKFRLYKDAKIIEVEE